MMGDQGYRPSNTSVMHDFFNNLLCSLAASDRAKSGLLGVQPLLRLSNEVPHISKGATFIQGPTTTIRITSGAEEERYRATGKRILEAFRLRKQTLLASRPCVNSNTNSSHGGPNTPAGPQSLFQTSFASRSALEDVFSTQAANGHQPQRNIAHLCTCCTPCVVHRQLATGARSQTYGGADGSLLTPSTPTPTTHTDTEKDQCRLSRLSHSRSLDLIHNPTPILHAKSSPGDVLVHDYNGDETLLQSDSVPAASDVHNPLKTTDQWMSSQDVPTALTPSSPTGLIKTMGGGGVPPSLSTSRLQFVRQVLGAPAAQLSLASNSKPPTTYRRTSSHAVSNGTPPHAQQVSSLPASVMADPLVDLLLTQVKTLMDEKRQLQLDLCAVTKENDALQELVGYLVEHQVDDGDDHEDDDNSSEGSGHLDQVVGTDKHV